ncbi:putative cytokinetic ring protein SteA [Corynebacterium timonense]|uniref:Uncharacterized membrane-anchored protein n=1 Tax=Corynebacterium timonense TaxID=441500 RepID=A0A1H1PFH4_9CORY|nr:putative cytokinetic ring protein SteA [Corynebacterium timonense]SDS09830.1 Uncharacterized membrane-anchored protein [Corynebacterium timonense]
MHGMSVFSRASADPAGSTVSADASPVEVQGTLRDCTSRGKGLRKLRAGEIAVVDSRDMSRREAEQLIAAAPAAVLNLSTFSTGAMPNYGPHLLLDAGIALYEARGDQLRELLRDGKKASVQESGLIHVGKRPAGEANAITRGGADETFATAQRNLLDHMEAYFGNTIEFIHSESPLLIDGVGVPEMGETMSGRKVLIVADAADAKEKLGRLRNFIREYEPVLIGAGAGANVISEAGYEPDFIVGDPTTIAEENLRGQARVVLPADPDGHAAGLERIQDLGVGAMTFPAATDSALDLAILLARFHDAEMIVTVSDAADLDAIFAGAPHASPAAMLTRLKAGNRIVDSTVIDDLYAVQSGGGLAWAWAVLGLLVAVATIILVVGLGGDGAFAENLVDTWDALVERVQGWFEGWTQG